MGTRLSVDRGKLISKFFLENGRDKTCEHFGFNKRNLSNYLCEIKKFKLLTANEVIETDKKFNSVNISKEISIPKINVGITLEDFRSKNDPKFIIREGLKKLTKDRVLKTVEFKQLINLPMNFSSNMLEEMTELENYHGKCSSGTYWSHPEVIAQLKSELILR